MANTVYSNFVLASEYKSILSTKVNARTVKALDKKSQSEVSEPSNDIGFQAVDDEDIPF